MASGRKLVIDSVWAMTGRAQRRTPERVRDSYPDRVTAGERLADLLTAYADREDVTVLGLVRGGVPVAAKVATRLGAPLDVLVVRKLGVPGAPELAFGALGPGGVLVLNEEIANYLQPREIESVHRAELTELQRREEVYRADQPPLDLTGRTAIIVDDGLATGATARASVPVARALRAARVVVAAPVGAPEAVALVKEVADEMVCPLTPPDFGAVSRYYERFPQVSDSEVMELVAATNRARAR
jgi:putative phosphoribosyl transferase